MGGKHYFVHGEPFSYTLCGTALILIRPGPQKRLDQLGVWRAIVCRVGQTPQSPVGCFMARLPVVPGVPPLGSATARANELRLGMVKNETPLGSYQHGRWTESLTRRMSALERPLPTFRSSRWRADHISDELQLVLLHPLGYVVSLDATTVPHVA